MNNSKCQNDATNHRPPLFTIACWACFLSLLNFAAPSYAQEHWNYDGTPFVPSVEITAFGIGHDTLAENLSISNSIDNPLDWADGEHAVAGGVCVSLDPLEFLNCTLPNPTGWAVARVIGNEGTVKLRTGLQQLRELQPFYTTTAKANISSYVKAVGPAGITTITFELPFDGSSSIFMIPTPNHRHFASVQAEAEISLTGEVLDAPPTGGVDPLPRMGLKVSIVDAQSNSGSDMFDETRRTEVAQPLTPIDQYEIDTGTVVADTFTFTGLRDSITTGSTGGSNHVLFIKPTPTPSITMKVPANTQIPVFIRMQVQSACQLAVSCESYGKFHDSFYVAAKPEPGYTIESTGPFKLVGQNFAPSEASPGSLSFTVNNIFVNENAGNAQVSVERTGGSTGSVTVNLATTSGGRASAPSDFTAVNTTVSFADGDVEPKTVNIPIVADNLTEADETIVLALSGPTGGAQLGSQSGAQITIRNTPIEPEGGGDDGGCTIAHSGASGTPDPLFPTLLLSAGVWFVRRSRKRT